MKVRVLDEVVPEPGEPSLALDLVISLASFRTLRLVGETPERDGLSPRLRRWLGDARARELRSLFTVRPRSYPFDREADLVAGASDFDATPIRVGPEDVLWLRLPLRVYLENSRNDWGFVSKSVPSVYQTAFIGALEWKLFEPEAGGGLPEMVEIVKHQHAHDASLCRRSWFIFDSDGPPGQPSAKARELTDRLRALRIPFHILRRRAIENYVPRRQRRAWVHCDPHLTGDRELWMDAFDALSDPERWAFPMKAGDPARPSPLDGGLPLGRRHGATPLSAVWGDPAWPVPGRDLDEDGSKAERVDLVKSLLAQVA